MDFDSDQESITPHQQPYIKLETTGALWVASGTTAQRPASPQAGMFRYNSDTPGIEYHNGSIWISVPTTGGGGSPTEVTLDTSGTTSVIAAANTALIQAALNAKGYVRLTGVGVAPVTGTHIIKSNTTLQINDGLTLANYTNLTGSNVPMFVNEHWQSGAGVDVVNGVIDFAAAYVFTVSGVTVTPTTGATYTNNGATFTVLGTSITTGSGTITCGATNAPTGTGTLTKATGTGDATIAFSAATTIFPVLTGVRVAFADMDTNAHGFAIGDWILTKGDVYKSYTGVWQVLYVIDGFKYLFLQQKSSAIGAQVGTITVSKANANITVSGGATVDYRGHVNQASYTYNAHMFCFNKVKNLTVKELTLANCTKFSVSWQNIQHARFLNLTCYSASAAIQGCAFGMDIVHSNIMGATGDDFIAYVTDNTGYTQYDIPNGDMAQGGDLFGFTVRDLHVQRTTQHCVGIFASDNTMTYELSGILIDGIYADTAPGAAYVTVGLPTTVDYGLGIRDVVIRNVRGPWSISAPLIQVGGSGITVGIDSLTIERCGSPAQTAIAYFSADKAQVNRLRIDADCRVFGDSTAAPLALCEVSSTAMCSDVEISGFEVHNSSGSNDTQLFNSSGTVTTLLITRNKFYDNSIAYAGSVEHATIDMNVFDTYSAVRATGNNNIKLTNNRWRLPGGANIPVVLYGAGTVSLRAYDNDWGDATNWLQLGTASGDSLTVDVWAGSNGSANGYGTGVFKVSNTGTFNLVASDATMNFDKAIWSSIAKGATFNHTGTNPGIYVQGSTTSNQLTDALIATASEALSANQLVNVWDNGGVLSVRVASSALGYEANGFVLKAYSSSAAVEVHETGAFVSSGLTVGPLFLSTAGGVTSVKPAEGKLVQRVGFAKSATVVLCQLGVPVQT